MAYELSGHRWLPARHLRLLSERLVDLAARKVTRLIVSMPPRHGKSELVSHWYPVWYLNMFPEHEVMLASYGADFAAEWGMKVRDSIVAARGQISLKLGSKQRENRFYTTRGGNMGTSGVGGQMSGKGAHLLIIDDPIKNSEEADSKLHRQKVWDWWQSTAYTRLAPNGVVVLVMTRWHEDDLAGRLLKQTRDGEGERWEELKLPALAEEHDALGRAYGEALWPARYGIGQFALMKASMLARWWLALYQQRPSAEEGDIFLKGWWRRYGALPERLDQIIQSWDCTFKNLKSSDFVVGQVWGRLGPDRYLIHQVRDRMSFTQTLAAVRGLSAQYPKAVAKLVEDKANGTAVMDVLRKELSGLIPVEPMGGKTARAWAVQPFVQAGNVWIPTGAPGTWVDEFVEECASFPNGMNDDQVDAMTQALIYLRDSRAAAGGTIEPEPEDQRTARPQGRFSRIQDEDDDEGGRLRWR